MDMKNLIEIKHRYTGSVLFESFSDSMKDVLEESLAKSANLGGANLKGADLKGANLKGADLEGADLKGAYLEGANLEGADLKGANLKGANLKGANLEGANLEGAGVKVIIIQGSKHKLQANRDACKIGCVCKKWEWWNCENIQELGAGEGYAAAQIEEYKRYIEFARVSIGIDSKTE